jgi:predicted O-methyltransferase YrrM
METEMRKTLAELLAELERFGKRNDRAAKDVSRCMLNITRETGELFFVLARAVNAKDILEIGTSNGYSTLWWAEAARASEGMVTTVEVSDWKISLAEKNFRRAGLFRYIRQVRGDGGLVLKKRKAASFDVVFLDSFKDSYVGWWPEVKRVLRPGGLLVADNTLTHAGEMAGFMKLVERSREFVSADVPVGNGELVAVKARG